MKARKMRTIHIEANIQIVPRRFIPEDFFVRCCKFLYEMLAVENREHKLLKASFSPYPPNLLGFNAVFILEGTPEQIKRKKQRFSVLAEAAFQKYNMRKYYPAHLVFSLADEKIDIILKRALF